ncbi:cellular morphogenesis protein [Stagonosporopsis vannaccii]|nr:cellular morphogenesis protein [Stagonosporopsis vannaccii]
MAKRKRSEASPALSDIVPAAEKLLKRQKKAVSARLAAAQKPLVAALRLGAGFERQKHSRRKKTAVQKKDTKALTRLDDEYRVLKALDLDKVAEQHIRRTIAKVKTLKDHGALPEDTKLVEKTDSEPARLNVLARLYKVAAVKKEVDALIDDLKEIVGGREDAGEAERAAQLQGTGQREKKRKYAAEDAASAGVEDVDMLDFSDEDGVAARLFNARIAAPSSGEESDCDLSDDDWPPSMHDSDSDAHDPDADLAAASSSDTGSFDGFSDNDSNSEVPLSRSVALPSDSEHSDSASSISLIAASNPKSTKDVAKTSTSTFLPGLSHAAYFSGDESASDLDEKPRKNRRGQRARQKLAELKYGAKAKHIEKIERKQGWDAKRGAVSSDARPGNRRDRRAAEKDLKGKGGRGPVRSGENAAPLGKRRADGAASKQAPKKDDTGPLHPSWAAAKAAKESKKLKIDLGGAKSAKKITFD